MRWLDQQRSRKWLFKGYSQITKIAIVTLHWIHLQARMTLNILGKVHSLQTQRREHPNPSAPRRDEHRGSILKLTAPQRSEHIHPTVHSKDYPSMSGAAEQHCENMPGQPHCLSLAGKCKRRQHSPFLSTGQELELIPGERGCGCQHTVLLCICTGLST